MNREIVNRMMLHAIALSKQCTSSVYPNPKVGAVIFDDEGEILSEGYTQEYGGSHAEVVALSNLDFKGDGLNMAVTLEPCNHFGKTPPCSHAIFKAGIKSVFVAKREENSIAERGGEWLQQHNITVEFLEQHADAVVKINRFFFKNTRENRAWATIKVSQSQDGFIAADLGIQTQISSPESNLFVHQLRAEYPAIAVGAKTVTIDNPQLSIRLCEGENPQPVIYSASLSLPDDAVVYQSKPIIFTEKTDNLTELRNKSCHIESVLSNDIKKTLEILFQTYKKSALLVEGGALLIRSFFDQNMVDEVIVITSPHLLKTGHPGNMKELLTSEWHEEESFNRGEDSVTRYRKIYS